MGDCYIEGIIKLDSGSQIMPHREIELGVMNYEFDRALRKISFK